MIARALATGAALLAASPASAAVTIGAQIVDTRLSGTIAGAPATSDGSDAGTRTGRISAAAQLVERLPSGGAAVRGLSTVTADLSADRGRVSFRRTLASGTGAVEASAANYRYFFTTDGPAAFDIDWGVSAYGSGAAGMAPGQALSLAARGSGDTLLLLDRLGDQASGSREVTLDAGSYELRIFDAIAPVAATGMTSGLSSQYSFSIRSVPEPATWATLSIGFAAAGMMLRRKAGRPGSPARPQTRYQMKPRSRGASRSSST